MENLINEFKQKMYLDGKSERTIEVYGNSVKEFFRWFSDSYGAVEFKKLYRENILEYKSAVFHHSFIDSISVFLNVLLKK